ncbi:MAG TPA: PKD domain-containing protein [Acidimicrobiales bacterium]|nr:PKD domain-containing protein [Acidimicrobiales bacterium]
MGYASCLARIIDHAGETSHFSFFTRAARVPIANPDKGGSSQAVVSGLSPTNIESVYGFSGSSSAGTGKTIAIVDAYDDPTAAADLSTFSTQWNLPSCTTNSGCFTKVNQTGGSSLPSSNGGWALEISLDIEWAHAVAPGARVLLVEAKSNSLSNLFTADQYAGAHASYVSNSWGGSEFSGENSEDFVFQGGASFFVATGDSGGAVDYPATSPNVVAVGGTSLKFNSNGTLSSETAWSAGGGGCSAYENAPAAQSSFAQYAQTGCANRSVPDVSLDADPNSGVAVYDSTSGGGCPGWCTVGGTSVATPIWAAESAVAGISPSPANLYGASGTPSFRDITGGSNGHPALVGYDLATGRGSWANGAPAAPTSLNATAGNAQVSLTWTGGSGATSYNVYRGTTATGLSTTPIATVTVAQYTDHSVSNGSTYYYEVEGVNTTGTGSPSNEASASPSASLGGGGGGGGGGPTPPPAPSTLTASYNTAGYITLNWGSSAGATSYTVLRSTTSGNEASYVTGITSLTYKDTSLSPGSTYYYKVEGVVSGVAGNPSPEASAPVPTSHLTAGISKGCYSTSCSFTSTSTDTGGTITTYHWTNGSGSGTGSTYSAYFYMAGTYVVYLTVTDNNGATAKTSTTVTCTSYYYIGTYCS